MIIIEREDYIDKMNRYGFDYGRKLLSDLQHSSFIDSSYTQSIVKQIDTFAPVLRMQCLNDMTILHQDTKMADQLQKDYDSFGEYCYDMLVDCFDASNECMQYNNKLAHDINESLNLEHSDLAVSSNYIAWNTFSKQAKLVLTDFKSISGLGLSYDIKLNAHGPAGIVTNNVQEFITPKLNYIIEISEILSQMQIKESTLNRLLMKWSPIVNDKLSERKGNAILAWYSTYQAYKETWVEVMFRKQIKDIYCTITIKNGTIIETLHRFGKTNTVHWGTNVNMVAVLDYLNITNIRFDE